MKTQKQILFEEKHQKRLITQEDYTENEPMFQGRNIVREHSHIRNTNISSTIVLIIALLCLLVFFSFVMSNTKAQEEEPLIADGEAAGGFPMEIAYLMSAVNAVEEHDLQMAVHWFEAALEENPEFAAPYIGIAHVYFLMGDYALALENAALAQQMNPNDGSVYYVLGEVECRLGNMDAALYSYVVYLIWVETFEQQPILIRRMIGENSVEAIAMSIASCMSNRR